MPLRSSSLRALQRTAIRVSTAPQHALQRTPFSVSTAPQRACRRLVRACVCSMAAPPAPPRLRLLCLHGYTQDGALFRERTGALRTTLSKAGVAMEYVDAPHTLTAADLFGEGMGPGDGRARGWFTAGENAGQQDPAAWTRPSLSKRTRGADESLAFLRKHIQDHGPYDGLLAFSQGAAMAGILLASEPSRFRFAILCAGFLASDPALAAVVQGAAPLPHAVLSCSGEADALVPPERVRALAACFPDPACVFHAHPGGHHVPGNAAFRNAVRDFLAPFAAAAPGGGRA